MAVDAFLEIKDSGKAVVEGESLDKKHPKLIQIRDYSFSIEQKASSDTGTGLGSGKAELKEFSFTVSNSKASPVLVGLVCKGDHCDSAVLYIRKAGGGQADYYIWTFKELLITKFEFSGSEEISEKISFAYTAVHCEYKPQKADGSLDSGIKFGWDVKENDTFSV